MHEKTLWRAIGNQECRMETRWQILVVLIYKIPKTPWPTMWSLSAAKWANQAHSDRMKTQKHSPTSAKAFTLLTPKEADVAYIHQAHQPEFSDEGGERQQHTA